MMEPEEQMERFVHSSKIRDLSIWCAAVEFIDIP